MQANMTNIIVFINYTQPDNTIISSYAISIMYIGMSLGSVVLGPLADRTEPKKVLAASLSLTGVGCAIMLLFTAQTSVIILAASLGILGFGLGGNAAIFMKVVLSGVPNDAAGTGTEPELMDYSVILQHPLALRYLCRCLQTALQTLLMQEKQKLPQLLIL